MSKGRKWQQGVVWQSASIVARAGCLVACLGGWVGGEGLLGQAQGPRQVWWGRLEGKLVASGD